MRSGVRKARTCSGVTSRYLTPSRLLRTAPCELFHRMPAKPEWSARNARALACLSWSPCLGTIGHNQTRVCHDVCTVASGSDATYSSCSRAPRRARPSRRYGPACTCPPLLGELHRRDAHPKPATRRAALPPGRRHRWAGPGAWSSRVGAACRRQRSASDEDSVAVDRCCTDSSAFISAAMASAAVAFLSRAVLSTGTRIASGRNVLSSKKLSVSPGRTYQKLSVVPYGWSLGSPLSRLRRGSRTVRWLSPSLALTTCVREWMLTAQPRGQPAQSELSRADSGQQA